MSLPIPDRAARCPFRTRRDRKYPAARAGVNAGGIAASVHHVGSCGPGRSGLREAAGPGRLGHEFPWHPAPGLGMVAVVLWKTCRTAVRRCRLRRAGGRATGLPVLRQLDSGREFRPRLLVVFDRGLDPASSMFASSDRTVRSRTLSALPTRRMSRPARAGGDARDLVQHRGGVRGWV